mgnify:CR=1 FL=1
MEVKNRKNPEAFFETKIKLDNFIDGMDFLKALGMTPYLYMNRTREILEYNGLKLFIDDIDLLGLFLEIEYQDTENAIEKVKEFINIIGIEDEKAPLYGDIFKEKIENDISFKEEFETGLNKFLNDLKNRS